ncbi:hypothetical protein C9F11_40950 [Streptomyces sp. YIM 121038]|uniref:hypothetical protein n=1 Tax=Streptomyces sp. YIM 121038 TaxID=2136401 RepID=UPI0011103047|nr:hypothetical protein [Streptomyces sp. YIM 121038]QCX81770.1 hypothetical protein C9F11_40950 [Streptomyces sp. YIM 121038]
MRTQPRTRAELRRAAFLLLGIGFLLLFTGNFLLADYQDRPRGLNFCLSPCEPPEDPGPAQSSEASDVINALGTLATGAGTFLTGAAAFRLAKRRELPPLARQERSEPRENTTPE